MSVLRYARFAALGFARTVQYEATLASTDDMGDAGLLVGRKEPQHGGGGDPVGLEFTILSLNRGPRGQRCVAPEF